MKIQVRILLALIIILSHLPIHAEADMDFDILDMRHGLSESRIRSVAWTPDNRLAIATTANIDIFDGTRFSTYYVEPQYTYPLKGYTAIRYLYCDNRMRIWRKTNKKLHVLDLEQGKYISNVDSLFEQMGVDHKVTNIYICDSLYWTTDSLGGLYVSNGKHCKRITGLPFYHQQSDTPEKLLQDGNMVYLFYQSGIVYKLDTGSLQYTYNDYPHSVDGFKRPSKGVTPLIKNDKLYISYRYYNEGNYLDQGQSILRILNAKDLSCLKDINLPFAITSMTFDRKGRLVVSGTKGCYIYSLTEEEIDCSSPEICYHHSLHGVCVDNMGGLWMGDAEKGLLYYNPERIRPFHTKDMKYSFQKHPVYCTERARSIATRLASGSTNCTLEDKVGYLYIGTRKGLMVVNPKDSVLGMIDNSYGLISNNIQSITTDMQDRIWVVTAQGICCILRRADECFEITHFGYLDGIRLNGKEFLPNRLSTDSTGRMYAGFVDGTCIFTPDSIGMTRYTYRFPHETTIATEETEMNLSYILLSFLILGSILTFIFIQRNKRKRKNKKNQKENCRKLMSIATNQVPDSKTTTAITSDDLFLEKLKKTVEKHISEEEFNVQSLSEFMAMERTVLYRRMQQLTSMSPSIYIKSARMNLAKQLLTESDVPIADIAIRTGFSTTQYFSRVFKETFGITPNEYRNSNT